MTRLKEVKGLGEAAITELKIVHAAATLLARGEVKQRPVLSARPAPELACFSRRAWAGDPGLRGARRRRAAKDAGDIVSLQRAGRSVDPQAMASGARPWV